MSYDQELKNEWDNNSALAYAREEGVEQVALKMIDADIPLDQISTFTGLTIEKLADLNHS